MLVPSRPNSKLLAHLIMAFLNKTKDLVNTELLVMPAKRNEWNQDLVEYIGKKEPSIRFIPEPENELGQRGHHVYINELAKHAKGDWVFNFCDDMDILTRDWDEYVREFIRNKGLDHNKCYVLVPRFKQAGAVEHILSRTWIETVGCVFNFPNGDSWLNTVTDTTPEIFRLSRRLEIHNVMFEDFSNIEGLFHLFNEEGLKRRMTGTTPNSVDWNSEEVQRGIKEAAGKLFKAMQNGR